MKRGPTLKECALDAWRKGSGEGASTSPQSKQTSFQPLNRTTFARVRSPSPMERPTMPANEPDTSPRAIANVLRQCAGLIASAQSQHAYDNIVAGPDYAQRVWEWCHTLETALFRRANTLPAADPCRQLDELIAETRKMEEHHMPNPPRQLTLSTGTWRRSADNTAWVIGEATFNAAPFLTMYIPVRTISDANAVAVFLAQHGSEEERK